MNQLLNEGDFQQIQQDKPKSLMQSGQQNDDQLQQQSSQQTFQQDKKKELELLYNSGDPNTIYNGSQINSDLQQLVAEIKIKLTTQEMESTTIREHLKSDKQQLSKTTKITNLQKSKRIYINRNTISYLHLRTAQQFDRKIVHDQLNRSHSKQQYSFSKAERFSKPNKSYCAIQFYDSQFQTQLSKRSAALGYGTKSDFTKRDKYIPGPTDYNVQLQPKPGVKFAYGRDEMPSNGLHGRPNTNPAPNLYQVKDIITAFKYSMGKRTSAKHIYLESTTPAPGRYNVGGFTQKGNYFIGKYKSSGAPVISPSTAQSQRIQKVPGPGAYDPPGDIGDPRNYLPSQYSTQNGFRFGYQERQTQEIKNKQFPGPGTYQLPSEFGDFEYPPSF